MRKFFQIGSGGAAGGTAVHVVGFNLRSWAGFPDNAVVQKSVLTIRIVQDKGAGVQGYHLDVAVDTHENALAWSGYGEHRVWIIREVDK